MSWFVVNHTGHFLNWTVKCFNPNYKRYLKVVLTSDEHWEPDLAGHDCQFCGMNFTSIVMNAERRRLQMPKAESGFSMNKSESSLSFEQLGFEDLKVGDRIQIKFKRTPNRANRTFEIRAFVDDRMVIKDNRGIAGSRYEIVDIYWWHIYAKDNCKVYRKSA